MKLLEICGLCNKVLMCVVRRSTQGQFSVFPCNVGTGTTVKMIPLHINYFGNKCLFCFTGKGQFDGKASCFYKQFFSSRYQTATNAKLCKMHFGGSRAKIPAGVTEVNSRSKPLKSQKLCPYSCHEGIQTEQRYSSSVS